MSSATARGQDRAWSWIAHLRAGGTTTWTGWVAHGEGPRGVGQGRFLPGAQQLELLRRLNLRQRPDALLVERVLTASAPGRGRPDLELVGVDEERRFGPPAVDPSELPDEELIRVATGLVAEDLVATGEEPPATVRRPRRWRVRYQLAGDPWLASTLTEALRVDGRPPGGAGRTVHVLGTDLATMLVHSWTTGTLAEGGPAWPDFVTRLRARDRVPRRVDLVAITEHWMERPHVGTVDVVLDPSRVAGLVGLRRSPRGVPTMAAHAAELSRQTAAALGLLVTRPRQTALLTTVLRPRLLDVVGAPPEVPDEHRDWVDEAATRLRRRLLRTGYPVVGDPDLLLPRWSTRPSSTPSAASAEVLDLALDLLLRPVGIAGEKRKEAS